jgi:dUTP pyrophosphatase
MIKDIIYFAKVKPNAKIPSKLDENGWYDVYACFDEDYIIINPGEIKLIPTGIASSCDSKYRIGLYERGSTGTKGLSIKAGRIDSGYRGEWFCCINNTSNKPIYIAKDINKIRYMLEEKYATLLQNTESSVEDNFTIYPYTKAICQAAIEIVPDVDIQEISYDELKIIHSQRGDGCLGSSGK